MRAYKFIFLFLILASCGSRKVAIDKIDTVVKVDSTSTIKKDEVVVTQNNVSINTDTDEMEICPISDTIPMVVNGITYKNAKIKYKKTKTAVIDTTKKEEVRKESQEVKLVKDKKEKVFKKQVDKKESYSIYGWWLLIILLVALFFYAKNKLDKTLL
jgi:S-adenosylmethionine synthetase